MSENQLFHPVWPEKGSLCAGRIARAKKCRREYQYAWLLVLSSAVSFGFVGLAVSAGLLGGFLAFLLIGAYILCLSMVFCRIPEHEHHTRSLHYTQYLALDKALVEWEDCVDDLNRLVGMQHNWEQMTELFWCARESEAALKVAVNLSDEKLSQFHLVKSEAEAVIRDCRNKLKAIDIRTLRRIDRQLEIEFAEQLESVDQGQPADAWLRLRRRLGRRKMFERVRRARQGLDDRS